MNKKDENMLFKVKSKGKKVGDLFLDVSLPSNLPKEVISTISKYEENEKIDLASLTDQIDDDYREIFKINYENFPKLMRALRKVAVIVSDHNVEGGNYFQRTWWLFQAFLFFVSCYLYYLHISLRVRGEMILIKCKIISKHTEKIKPRK